jgi:hypothetical protein
MRNFTLRWRSSCWMPGLRSVSACASLLGRRVIAAERDPCTTFTWNVAHELEVMKQTRREVLSLAHSTPVNMGFRVNRTARALWMRCCVRVNHACRFRWQSLIRALPENWRP